MSGDLTNGMASKPEDFRALNRKVIELPNGMKVVIRKLTGMDFLEMGGFPPVSGDPEATAKRYRKEMEGNPKAQLQQLRLILTKGIVSPRVVDVQPSETPDGSVSIYELGDTNDIVQAIMAWSGLTEEATRAAGKFPEGAGGAGVGRDGSEMEPSSK